MAKRQNPDLILGVGGCVAEQEGRALIDEVPWLSLVVGPGRLDEIPDILETMTASSPPVVLAGQSVPVEAQAPLGEPSHAEPESDSPGLIKTTPETTTPAICGWFAKAPPKPRIGAPRSKSQDF